MQISELMHATQIFVHWDHIWAPHDPQAGVVNEDSWMGLAKRVSGIVLFAISVKWINWKRSLLLFGLGGAYHFYCAVQKVPQKPDLPLPRTQEEIGRMNQLGIEALIKASHSGKKIGLIIGRGKEQSVPQEKGWLWVSGNTDGEPEVRENRIHLQMHFFNDPAIQKIQRLFNTVVVDYSTFKSISVPRWANLKELLKPENDATLITETWGISGYAHDEEIRVDVENGDFSLPMSAITDGSEERQTKEAITQVQTQAKKYLARQFKQVELKHQAPYPTRENFSEGSRDDIFVLTGPLFKS